MDRYSSYIRKLKQTAPKADFDSLYRRIEARSGAKKSVLMSRPLMGLAVAALLFFLAVPLVINRSGPAGEDSKVLAYVFQNDVADDHAVADFILND